MKRICNIIAALFGSAFPAIAADISTPPTVSTPLPLPDSYRVVRDHLPINAWLGGAILGANYQFGGSFLVGLEGELDCLAGLTRNELKR